MIFFYFLFKRIQVCKKKCFLFEGGDSKGGLASVSVFALQRIKI